MKKLVQKNKLEALQNIKDLTGVISLSKNFDYKKEISDYIWKKYNN